MRIGSAKLVKLKTDDGCMEMVDGIELGREYIVDLDSVHSVSGYNIPKQKEWQRDVIDIYEFGNCVGFFPIEVLEIDGETSRCDGAGTA